MSRADGFRALVLRGARQQVEMLLDPDAAPNPKADLHHAVVLIDDLVHRLGEPALAVEFALKFHRKVEVWSDWEAWESVLSMLLAQDGLLDPQRVQLLIFHSRLAQRLRNYAIAHTNALTALEGAQTLNERTLTAQALNQLATTAYSQDNFAQAKIFLEQIYKLGIEHISPEDAGNINLNLGNIAVQQEQLDEAASLFDKALFHYQNTTDEVQTGKVIANKADLLRRQGLIEQALEEIHKALRIFQVNGARHDLAVAGNSLGYIYLQYEQWDKAEESFQSAIREAEDLGALATKAWILPNIIELYVKTRRYQDVERLVVEAYQLAHLCHKPLATACIHDDYGLMLFECGEYERSHMLWLEALELKESHGATAQAGYTRSLLARLPVKISGSDD